ncbi:HD-GYP domain-containing protein [Fusibacter ferrireducens]|uniref:HD-GYP domain-containing protein n=1 Tax=Fusibacter ferrireducens TaxID=2785058 RepID=A0ABR9ZQ99_9FIRM|nr:HD-GYP domain-containing protein [Fusibacter ferrireducens]MBF4692624.1 HD-GYP domain-containing protein [Fusibacter ferrireducens]
MRFKPIEYLKENEVLAENIVNISNQILLRKNAIVNSKSIERIKALGFKSLYVKNPDEEEILEEEIKDIIDPAIRKKAVFDVKTCVDEFFSSLSKQKQQLVFGDSGQALIDTLDQVSSSLIDEILNSQDLTISIMDIKSESYYLYEHAINTAVLAIMLGAKIGLNTKDMRNIAIASILINIGYKNIPQEVYEHSEPLSESQWAEIKKHPKYSYDILSNNTSFNAHIKSIVLQHHERLNGSGYPNGLVGSEIHPHTKIVMLADVYDAMTSDRKHRLAHPHHEVVEYIMGSAGTLFDFDLASTFCRCIILYPAGSYVLLSNGLKAVILKNHASHPLRPIVRTFKNGKLNNAPDGYIDLLETHNLTIQKLIYD